MNRRVEAYCIMQHDKLSGASCAIEVWDDAAAARREKDAYQAKVGPQFNVYLIPVRVNLLKAVA